jgi:hypothetical protein
VPYITYVNGALMLNTASGQQIRTGLGGSTGITLEDGFSHVLFNNGGTPSIAAGAAAGTSPTVAVVAGSNDTRGRVNITMGTSPGTGVLATVTFASPYTVSPASLVITPATAQAGVNAVQVYVSSLSTTGFVLSVNVAGTATNVHGYYYHVIG